MAVHQVSMSESPESESPSSSSGPGERLQAARIASGKSRAEIAQQMHLSVQIIEAIEENDYNEITAPIFVRGYLRSFARIVGLDETEIVEQYNQQYSYDDPPISSTSNTPQDISINDARVKWTSYGLVLALALLVGVWWWNNHGADQLQLLDESSPSSEVMSSVESNTLEVAPQPQPISPPITEPTLEETPLLAQNSATTAEPETAPELEAENSTMEQPTTSDAAVVGSVEESVAAIDSEETPVENESAIETETSIENETETSQAPVLEENPEPMAAEDALDRLHLVVSADTWAEIKDSEGTRMIYDLIKADSDVEYAGVAPFSIFLGNATGVTIELNGKTQGFQSHIRKNRTARFQLP